MDTFKNALPPEGGAKPAQNTRKTYEITCRDRLLLVGTLGWCLLAVDTVLWSWPHGMGLALAVSGWVLLLTAALGRRLFEARESRVLLVALLLLAVSFALTSSVYFRFWNFLALLALAPIHACGLSKEARRPWWDLSMVPERLLLLLRGLFGRLGATPAALSPPAENRNARRVLPAVLGGAAALALLGLLVPILSSADALFAAATAGLRTFIAEHLTESLQKLVAALALAPFLFGLLYRLRRPAAVQVREKAPAAADSLPFLMVLAALDILYLLFLAVQSAGLFGGADYLAARGISYAEWARSGFFQMVGVTMVNLTVLLVSLSAARREGRLWTTLRLLAALLVAESLVLLGSAAWRMTLYVSAYGLSFKRCMTYWGMVMMALFLLAASWKIWKPETRSLRIAAPLALAGWLIINCIPVDYLVAKNQVDRYLSGESTTIDAEYLLYDLSYDTVSQLERLDGSLICHDWRSGGQRRLSALIADRRAEAASDCADWRSWSLSACLAAGQSENVSPELAKISHNLSIDTSSASVSSSYDTHGGFHGDGAACIILRFPDSALSKTLSHSLLWHSLPLNQSLTAFAYGFSSETFSAGPYLTDESGAPLLPQIKNGYYYFEDRHADSTDPRSTAALLSRASINATLAVYDADTCTLYYCELDT